MTRKQTIAALFTMAKRIAKANGLNIVSMKDSTNGVWDLKGFTGLNKTLGEYFTEKHGKKLTETHFTAVPMEEYDLRKDFKVTVGYRFSNPQIEVGTQWGKDGFCCVEFGGDENDNNYQMEQATIFKESGQKYYRMIMTYWHEMRTEAGEDPLDWARCRDEQM